MGGGKNPGKGRKKLYTTLALHKHFFEMSNDLLKALKNRKNSL